MNLNDNRSVRAVHGSPFSELDTLLEDKTDLVIRSLEAIDEDILLCGHTHRPYMLRIEGKVLVNAGSVGMNYGGGESAQYTVLYADGDTVHADMRTVPYDFTQLKETSDLSDPWIRLCLKSIEIGKNLNLAFLEEAQRRGSTFPVPDDAYTALFREWCDTGLL